MNVATLMHRIDVIYLNDKGEPLAEGGPLSRLHMHNSDQRTEENAQPYIWITI